eukprot:RCo043460
MASPAPEQLEQDTTDSLAGSSPVSSRRSSVSLPPRPTSSLARLVSSHHRASAFAKHRPGHALLAAVSSEIHNPTAASDTMSVCSQPPFSSENTSAGLLMEDSPPRRPSTVASPDLKEPGLSRSCTASISPEGKGEEVSPPRAPPASGTILEALGSLPSRAASHQQLSPVREPSGGVALPPEELGSVPFQMEQEPPGRTPQVTTLSEHLSRCRLSRLEMNCCVIL